MLDIGLQDQLRPHLVKLKPRPSIYCQDFIAANQEERADNVLKGNDLRGVVFVRIIIFCFRNKVRDDGANTS